ncbi:hypothetical protein D6779_10255 [Candidatus Parcubacteria bacterium]|nr:MAG: hypothetical protein D6779_10255 [Candidatus Parcubacteria bacterium]
MREVGKWKIGIGALVGVLLATAFVLLAERAAAPPLPAGAECREDADCELRYSSCDCVAIPKDTSLLTPEDERLQFLEREKDKVCVMNICTQRQLVPQCRGGQCVKGAPAPHSPPGGNKQ